MGGAAVAPPLVEPGGVNALAAALSLSVLGILSLHLLVVAGLLAGALGVAHVAAAKDLGAYARRLSLPVAMTLAGTFAASAYWVIPLLIGRGPEGSVIGGIGTGELEAYAAIPEHGEIRPSQCPVGWYAADQALLADGHPARTLFLPWHQYMSLSFVRNQNRVVGPTWHYVFLHTHVGERRPRGGRDHAAAQPRPGCDLESRRQRRARSVGRGSCVTEQQVRAAGA